MQVANTNVYTIMDQSEEKKEALWAAWERDEGLEDLLRLTIQEVETQKVKHPELNISTSYQMGRLDGYTELLERLFRARECDKAIRNNPGLQTEKSQHILDILYKMGEALHVDLADAVGSSYSSLTEEMEEMSAQLIPLICELCEDGIPCTEAVQGWLESMPEEEQDEPTFVSRTET